MIRLSYDPMIIRRRVHNFGSLPPKTRSFVNTCMYQLVQHIDCTACCTVVGDQVFALTILAKCLWLGWLVCTMLLHKLLHFILHTCNAYNQSLCPELQIRDCVCAITTAVVKVTMLLPLLLGTSACLIICLDVVIANKQYCQPCC